MKKIYILLSLILTTSLFTQEKSELSSTKNTYFLEGTIDNKFPITMRLTIEENTKKVNGQYYYNKVKTPIYFGESVLDKNSTLTLKEFEKPYSHESKDKSTGEFIGKIDKKMVFKGTWSNGKKSFDFEVKPNKSQMIQEVELKKYSFKDSIPTKPRIAIFDFSTETFQIANPKKLAGINNINKELGVIDNFNEDFSFWKESPEEFMYLYEYHNSYGFIYRDNSIISINRMMYCYAGGAHGNLEYRPIVYSLENGKILNEKVSDLVYSIEDKKLIALLRKKLIEQMKERYSDEDNSDEELKRGYFDFETIRLNDHYEVNALGINFVYNQYEVASYAAGIITISFTYEELKPFVKKDSKLYYLFEEQIINKKYAQTLKSILDNHTPQFDEQNSSQDYLQTVNQIYAITDSQLSKSLESRDYNFVFWYIETHLSSEKNLLTEKLASYDELQEQIANVFPSNKFSNQFNMNQMAYLEIRFYPLIAEYYEMEYFNSLSPKLLKLAKQEKDAWAQYSEISVDLLDKLHFGEGSGSIAPLFKAEYRKDINNQYFRTIIDYYFKRKSSFSDFEIKDIWIDNAYKYFKKKEIEAHLPINETEREIFKTLQQEQNAWNQWIKIRDTYSKNLTKEELGYHRASTERLKKIKLINLKNLYAEYAVALGSFYDLLLKQNSSEEELLNYDYIEAMK